MSDKTTPYQRAYPQGFKRKRNSSQREKQRLAQRRYEKERRSGVMRRSMHALRKFAHGLKCGRTSCNELTGLPLAAFYQHICSTLAVPSLPFTLCFYTPLTRYDLDDTQQLRTAMHYTNVYAVTKASVALRAFV